MTLPLTAPPPPRWQGWLLYGALPLVAFAAAWWLFRHVFHCAPITTDENSYVFQAYNFIHGVVARPLPPLSNLFIHEMIILDDQAGWLARYPPGHPLWLLPGCLFHQPHFMVALAAALSIVVMAKTGALFGRREAWLAALLLLCSPFFLFTHGTLLGHTSGLLAALLLLYGFLRWQFKDAPGYAVLSGFGWAWLFLNRTYTALWLALPLGLYALLFLWQHRREKRAWLGTVLFGLTACAGIAAILIYNKLSTGHTHLMTYLLYDPTEGPGFGLKHASGLSGVHTLAIGLASFWANIKLLNLWCFGFTGSLVAAGALALLGWHKRWTPLLLAGPLLAWGGYIGYFYRGPQEIGPGYYFEALPFLLLGSALGLARLIGWLRPHKAALALAGMAVLALLTLDGRFAVRQGKELSNFNTLIGTILACERAAPTNALIIVTADGNPYADFHHGLAVFNPQGLDSQPLIVRSLGVADHLLARGFGARTAFHLVMENGTPRLLPFTPHSPYLDTAQHGYFQSRTGQAVSGGLHDEVQEQRAQAGRDPAEVLAFNQKFIALPGTFVMDFDLLISNAPPDRPAALLDLTLRDGNIRLASMSLTGDMHRVISMPIPIQQMELVEPRVFYLGAGDVTCRGFHLREMSTPATTRP